jgi:ABC-type transport system involved in cytochrome bd biosynthesis fused ATPase/permease subunit
MQIDHANFQGKSVFNEHMYTKAHFNCSHCFFSDAIGGFMTYILPAILFFFLRKTQEQTPTEATKYLSIIAFYGYVFWLLSSMIWISESCLICLTLGNHLWKLRKRLLHLHAFHSRRLKHDEITGIKSESSDLIQIVHLRIVVPDDYEQRVLQSNINLNVKRGECVLVNGSTGCGKTSLFRICAGLWPINAELVRLPARKQTIYIPQRPYLPIGSLRFQALFLLDIRCGKNVTSNIDDRQIRDLFQLVNMDYLLDRYELDTVDKKIKFFQIIIRVVLDYRMVIVFINW